MSVSRVRNDGPHFGLIVLRHMASLFCHQRGSQSSYGALVRCIESLASSSISSTWFRGQIRSNFVFVCKHVPFTILRNKKRNKNRGTMPACGRCRPADDAALKDLINLLKLICQGGSFWTNRAEAHGQLVLSPTRLPEQLRSYR